MRKQIDNPVPTQKCIGSLHTQGEPTICQHTLLPVFQEVKWALQQHPPRHKSFLLVICRALGNFPPSQITYSLYLSFSVFTLTFKCTSVIARVVNMLEQLRGSRVYMAVSQRRDGLQEHYDVLQSMMYTWQLREFDGVECVKSRTEDSREMGLEYRYFFPVRHSHVLDRSWIPHQLSVYTEG